MPGIKGELEEQPASSNALVMLDLAFTGMTTVTYKEVLLQLQRRA